MWLGDLRRRTACLVVAMAVTACGGDDDDPDETAAYAPTSDPIVDAPARTWSYVPIEGAICRDGSPTGVLFNPNPESDRLLVFLEEGAACFNGFSCLVAFDFDAEHPEERVQKLESNLGALNRATPGNPFADWNLAFVPYCSGDIHAGNARDVEIAGKTYQFNGFDNTTRILDRLAATVRDPAQVVLAGTSAGGWGAGMNYPKARRMFPRSEVILLVDSASYMGNAYLAPCWQKHMRDTWNLTSTLPPDCEGCIDSADGSFAEQLINYVLDTWPDFRGGLLETSEDWQMRLMAGYGEEGCARMGGGLPPDYPTEKFAAGLVDLRDRILAPHPGFRVFFDTGITHGFLSHTTYGVGVDEQAPRFDAVVDGVSVTQWVQAAVDGGEWNSVSAF